LTDSHGRTVSFKEAVIIMTSNAGTGDKQINVGFNKAEHDAVSTLENLSDYFKPEFLNRFDSIITFNELSEEKLLEIVDIMLDDLRQSLEEYDSQMTVSEDSKNALAKLGY